MHIDPTLVTALAMLLASLSQLIWTLRRRR